MLMKNVNLASAVNHYNEWMSEFRRFSERIFCMSRVAEKKVKATAGLPI